LFDEVVNLIIHQDYASASFLQRKFKIGYARAARILDQLEVAGYVGPAEGSKPREVIKRTIEGKESSNEVNINNG
jgi:S-DNA-T family DNA segregation ATPase FtsK/SpoIIIE